MSIDREEFRLRVALTGKDLDSAQKLRSGIAAGTLAASLALRVSGTDLNRRAADVLSRARISGEGALAVVQAALPHEFIQQNILAAWKALQRPVDSVVRRMTRIRLWGLPSPRPTDAFDFDEELDIAYRDDANVDPFRHRLDLFVPRGKKDFPVIVLVHGGCWVMGDNCCGGLYTSVGQFLASRGIGAVLPNYRLSPSVQHPAHVQDVASAVAWTRTHIAHYGGNSEQIFLMGHSAGGHLVSLLAADESYLKAEGLAAANIRGVVAVSGVYRIPPPGSIDYALGGAGPRSLRIDQHFPLRGEPPN
jgi:acetyl esterase/lipase